MEAFFRDTKTQRHGEKGCRDMPCACPKTNGNILRDEVHFMYIISVSLCFRISKKQKQTFFLRKTLKENAYRINRPKCIILMEVKCPRKSKKTKWA